MSEVWLDFERPVVELERRLADLKNDKAPPDEIARFELQLERTKKRIFSNPSSWQRVQLARHPNRPYTLDYVDLCCDDFCELRGDRLFGDDPAIVAGLARMEGVCLAIVGHQKGRDTKEKLRRSFGMPHPEGYRKSGRIMALAARFGLPILTLVDTPGAYPGIGAEERGQAEAIARNLRLMATLPVPIVSVVTGEGGSGGALGLGVGDRIFMLENSIYSVISPEGCAAILWEDSRKAPQAAGALKLTSHDLIGFGVIDGIIPEPLGGAHRDWALTARRVKETTLAALAELGRLVPRELVAQRVERFGRLGVWSEAK